MFEEVLYEKLFLTQVVARVDFIAPLPGLEKTLPSKLSKVLSDHFAIVEPTDAFTHQLQVKLVGDGEVQQEKTSIKLWNFYGKEREKQLTLSSQFVFVTYTRYSKYEGLKEDFNSVLSALAAAFPDARASRFGLRYINNIELDGIPPVKGWEQYISPALVGTATFFEAAALTRLVHIAEMKCGELNLRFQFGMPNPDYPAPMKRPSFVLDFDAYIQAAHEIATSLQYMDRARVYPTAIRGKHHGSASGAYECQKSDTRLKVNTLKVRGRPLLTGWM